MLKIAASIEKNSEHPLGEAIVKRATEEKLVLSKVEKFRSITGQGVEGIIKDKKVYVGKLITGQPKSDQVEKLNNQGKTVVYVYIDDKSVGLIAIADTIKETARRTVDQLNKIGLGLYDNWRQ